MSTTISPLRVKLITGATVGANAGGTSPWVDVRPYTNLTFYFKTNGNPGAGTCVIEESDFDPTTEATPNQTFSAIATVDVDASVGTDGQYAYHLSQFAYHFVRVRIGTTVTVATLDVVLVAV
jgi:hypothetical protein